MRSILIAILLIILSGFTFVVTSRNLAEFSREQPEVQMSLIFAISLLSVVVAVGILLGVSRLSNKMHRMWLGAVIPVGIFVSTALIISGVGTVLLSLAGLTWECTTTHGELHCEAHELVKSVKEFYAVVGAIVMSAGILGFATWFARRSSNISSE
jgi:hypothetical protein